MKKWESHHHKILGALLVIFGAIFFITPIPGTTLLIILGLVWLAGKRKTMDFLRLIFSRKLLRFFKVDAVVKRM